MQAEDLTLAPIEAPAESSGTGQLALTPTAAAARAVVPLRTAALARFSAAEAHIRDMVAQYAASSWDASTPAGLAAVKAARHEMREQGRFLVQRAVDATKKELNDLKNDVQVEGDRLIAILKPEEDRADGVIKTAEAAAAARAKRRETMLGNIATIRNYVALADGRGSADIARGIVHVRGLDVSPATWGDDFAPQAAKAQAEVLEALDRLHVAALEREQREERERQENERARAAQALLDELTRIANLAEEAKASGSMAAMVSAIGTLEATDVSGEHWGNMQSAAAATVRGALAELRGVLAVLAAAPAPAPAHAPAPAPAPKPQAEAPQAPAPAVAAPPSTAAAAMFADLDDDGPTPEAAAPAPAAAPAEPSAKAEPEPEPAADEVADIKLGDINTLMGPGFTMTAEFAASVCNVHCTRGPRGAALFTKSQARAIFASLIDRASIVYETLESQHKGA